MTNVKVVKPFLKNSMKEGLYSYMMSWCYLEKKKESRVHIDSLGR